MGKFGSESETCYTIDFGVSNNTQLTIDNFHSHNLTALTEIRKKRKERKEIRIELWMGVDQSHTDVAAWIGNCNNHIAETDMVDDYDDYVRISRLVHNWHLEANLIVLETHLSKLLLSKNTQESFIRWTYEWIACLYLYCDTIRLFVCYILFWNV